MLPRANSPKVVISKTVPGPFSSVQPVDLLAPGGAGCRPSQGSHPSRVARQRSTDPSGSSGARAWPTERRAEWWLPPVLKEKVPPPEPQLGVVVFVNLHREDR